MRRLVVVGGGISGLAAAWAARQAAGRIPGGLEVVVLERGEDVGGKARSIPRDGWLFEAGPSGFVGGRPELDRMIDACAMADQRVRADAASARRFLFRAGRMRRIVATPIGFARSGILSAAGLARLAVEPFIPARRDGAEETVWGFAARRLGREVADRMIVPMAFGIFAGNARLLSLPAAFPRMAALERDHGSLIRGLIARRGGTSPGPLTSFRRGTQALPHALAERGGFGVRCRADVRALVRDGLGWRVAVAGDSTGVPADAVILAAEPWASAQLLRALDDTTAAELDAIACPPVAVVALGYGEDESTRVPCGFGVLVALDEGFRALGNLWDSHIYPERCPKGHVLIRAMFGGAIDPAAGTLDETALIALARDEARRLYGIAAPPRFVHVVRWPRAIPQYELGHLDRVARIEGAVEALGGVFITGNGLRGVAFADAAVNGLRCGERAAEHLAGATSGPER